LVAVVFVSVCSTRGAPPASAAHASAAHAPAVTARSGTSAATSPARPVAGESPDLTFWRNRADLIEPPPPPRPVPLALPRVLRWRAPNGLDVVVVPRPGLPIVSFSVAIKAGGYDERKNQTQGVADFTAAMLRKGTRTRTADQVSDAIDFVGGSLDTGTGAENTVVTCSAPSTSARLCLDLLADVLLHPTFPEAEMPEIRDQVMANLAARIDDPHQLAAEHFDNLFFGEGHPDGWVLAPEHVRAITRDRLVEFWKTFYRPNNAMLAVAGDVDVAALKATIARAFAAWKPAPIPARPAFQIPVAHGMRAILVDKPDLSQTTMMFGHVGIRHADPDWYAVTLVDYVLGGSDFSSRLMTEVRSKRGLTYGIGSSFGAPLYQGAFRVSAATRNETAWDALLVAIDEIRKMKAEGPTTTELSKAQGYYAGSTPFELESAAGLARGIVGAELHGLGIAYVQDLAVRLGAIDVVAARAAAKAHLFPDDLAVVLVGRADVIEPQLRQAKIVYEKVDYRAPISSAARAAAAGSPRPPSSPQRSSPSPASP
jgi:zinc protease